MTREGVGVELRCPRRHAPRPRRARGAHLEAKRSTMAKAHSRSMALLAVPAGPVFSEVTMRMKPAVPRQGEANWRTREQGGGASVSPGLQAPSAAYTRPTGCPTSFARSNLDEVTREQE